eukprot:2493872-Rhodomonas_salina.3
MLSQYSLYQDCGLTQLIVRGHCPYDALGTAQWYKEVKKEIEPKENMILHTKEKVRLLATVCQGKHDPADERAGAVTYGYDHLSLCMLTAACVTYK